VENERPEGGKPAAASWEDKPDARRVYVQPVQQRAVVTHRR